MRRSLVVPGAFRSRRARAWLLIAGAVGLTCGLWAARVPYDRAALDPAVPGSVRIVDRTGAPLRITAGARGARAEWVALGQVSPRVVQATLAAEDRRFFRHPGVDPRALGRAAYRNLRARRVVSGGSTITQQLAGMLWPEPRTMPGKLREAVRAFRLECDFSKNEILEQYLNRAPYGNGTLGITAASERLLSRGPQTLSAGQAATLAALPQSPTRLGGTAGRAALQARRDWILGRMVRAGDLSAAEAAEARARALELDPDTAPFAAPHFADQVLQVAARTMPQAARIETTLDLELQSEIEGIVRNQLQTLRGRGVHDMAVVVEEVQSGDILALVGSPDWSESQVNGALALRQPGSALKPFLYAAAFEAGVSPADVLPDLPFAALDGARGEVAPRNYDGRWHGPVRAREALASSFNVPAVRLQERLGTRRVLDTLRRAGLSSLTGDASTYGLGLVLGVGEVTLLDLTSAYAGLARSGVYREPRWVRAATDARGRVLALPEADASGSALSQANALHRWTTPAAAFQVADILTDDAARIPGFGAHSALDLPFPVAVKTGTSTDYRNSWCIGFSADHAVGVWLGNFDGTSLHGLAGASGAGPVFRSVMLRLQSRGTHGWTATPPPGWRRQSVCALSGARPSVDCPSVVPEWFAPGTWEARERCTWHRAVGTRITVDWPPEYQDWAQANGVSVETAGARIDAGLDGAGSEPLQVGAPPQADTLPHASGPPYAGERRLACDLSHVGAPRIVSPIAGSVYFRDPRLPKQSMRFIAAAAAAGDRWILDGKPLVSGARVRDVWWTPSPGEHRLELHRGTASAAVEFSVR